MLEGDAVERGALEAGELLGRPELAGGRDLLRPARRRRCRPGASRAISGLPERHVLEVGMERHGQRRGQRPRGRRPDDGVDLAAGQRRVDRRRVGGEPVAHIDRRAGVHRRTPPRPRPARCGRGCTSRPASGRGRRSPSRGSRKKPPGCGPRSRAPWSCRACPSGRSSRCARIARSAGRRTSARRRGRHPEPREPASPAFCGPVSRRP